LILKTFQDDCEFRSVQYISEMNAKASMTSQIQSDSRPVTSQSVKESCQYVPWSATGCDLTLPSIMMNEQVKRKHNGTDKLASDEGSIKCIFGTLGCPVTLKPAEVESHQENCTFQSALCQTFNCKKMVLNLDEKARNKSLERQMKEVVQHGEECEDKMTVQSSVSVLKIEESTTTSDELDKQGFDSIKCIFCTSGCSEILKPGELELHQVNCQFQSGFCRAHNCNKMVLHLDEKARNQSFEMQVNNISQQQPEENKSEEFIYFNSEESKIPTDLEDSHQKNECEVNQLDITVQVSISSTFYARVFRMNVTFWQLFIVTCT